MKNFRLLIGLCTLIMLLSGCAAIMGVDKDILANVQKGMNQEEITRLLGRPDFRRFNDETEEWEYLKYLSSGYDTSIIVVFKDGYVIGLDSYKHEENSTPTVTVCPPAEVKDPVPLPPHPPVYIGRAMPEQEFQSLFAKIKSKPFKDDQLQLMEVGFAKRRITCKQCIQLMSIYTFDDDKLKVLNLLASHIVDRENQEDIVKTFGFTLNQNQARKILEDSFGK